MLSLEDLRDLFTGVPDESGEWATTPCYTVALALEVCRRCHCTTEHSLRTILFDSSAVDDIPERALTVMRLAVERYRTERDMQMAGRGL